MRQRGKRFHAAGIYDCCDAPPELEWTHCGYCETPEDCEDDGCWRDALGEHLAEARAVEAHQEAKHGDA